MQASKSSRGQVAVPGCSDSQSRMNPSTSSRRPINEQIVDLLRAQLPQRELLVVFPQTRTEFREFRVREQHTTTLVVENVFGQSRRRPLQQS